MKILLCSNKSENVKSMWKMGQKRGILARYNECSEIYSDRILDVVQLQYQFDWFLFISFINLNVRQVREKSKDRIVMMFIHFITSYWNVNNKMRTQAFTLILNVLQHSRTCTMSESVPRMAVSNMFQRSFLNEISNVLPVWLFKLHRNVRNYSLFLYSVVGLHNKCQITQMRHKGFYVYFTRSALDETTNYICSYLNFFSFPLVCYISNFAWKRSVSKAESPHIAHTAP